MEKITRIIISTICLVIIFGFLFTLINIDEVGNSTLLFKTDEIPLETISIPDDSTITPIIIPIDNNNNNQQASSSNPTTTTTTLPPPTILSSPIQLIDSIRLLNVSYTFSLETFQGLITIHRANLNTYFTARWIGPHVVGVEAFGTIINNNEFIPEENNYNSLYFQEKVVAPFQLPKKTIGTYHLSIISLLFQNKSCLVLNFDRGFIPPECNQPYYMRQEVMNMTNQPNLRTLGNLTIPFIKPTSKNKSTSSSQQVRNIISTTSSVYWTFNPPELFPDKIAIHNKLEFSPYFVDKIAIRDQFMRNTVQFTIADGRFTNYDCMKEKLKQLDYADSSSSMNKTTANNNKVAKNGAICIFGDSHGRNIATEIMTILENDYSLRGQKVARGYRRSISQKIRWYSTRFPFDAEYYFNTLHEEVLQCSVVVITLGVWTLSTTILTPYWSCKDAKCTTFVHSLTTFEQDLTNLILYFRHELPSSVKLVFTTIEQCPGNYYEKTEPKLRDYHLKPYDQTFNVRITQALRLLNVTVVDLFKVYDPIAECSSDFCHYTMWIVHPAIALLLGEIFPECVEYGRD
jgi:hypothetical protein